METENGKMKCVHTARHGTAYQSRARYARACSLSLSANCPCRIFSQFRSVSVSVEIELVELSSSGAVAGDTPASRLLNEQYASEFSARRLLLCYCCLQSPAACSNAFCASSGLACIISCIILSMSGAISFSIFSISGVLT